MVILALLKLFGDVPSFRPSGGKLEHHAEHFPCAWHRYKAALVVAYSSSPCYVFSSCKKDYTMLSIYDFHSAAPLSLLIKAVELKGTVLSFGFVDIGVLRVVVCFCVLFALFTILCCVSFNDIKTS